MIRKESKAIETLLAANQTANAESDVYPVGLWRQLALQITNPGADTIQIFKSLSDASDEESMVWTQHGSDISGDDWITIKDTFRYLKVVRGSGTTSVTVTMMGSDPILG
jgi:hypothetical protein